MAAATSATRPTTGVCSLDADDANDADVSAASSASNEAVPIAFGVARTLDRGATIASPCL